MDYEQHIPSNIHQEIPCSITNFGTRLWGPTWTRLPLWKMGVMAFFVSKKNRGDVKEETDVPGDVVCGDKDLQKSW